MKRKRYFTVAGALLAVAILLITLVPLPVHALSRTVTQRVMKSVVQIIAAEEGRGGRIEGKWSGSGTIISEDGLILTNCHVAMPRAMWNYPEFDYDVLIVALTSRSDEPPEPTFVAEVAQYSPELDLAVIRITHYIDGRAVDPDKLNLSALSIADSDELEIGDGLYILGYPGIGGETITFTSGNVSGFSRERGVTGRAWIKTDATIAGGNSGGTGINEQGELVGVPTQGGSGSEEADVVDCRYIVDTNGDGRIDENDTCVPMGGFINALRPVNLAQPLIEAAKRGLGPAPVPSPSPKPQPQPVGDASVGRLIFAPAVNEANQPVTVAESFPSGSEEIYLLFDYEDFQDGAAWKPELIYEGQVYSNVWPLSNWDGGPAGLWWISVYNEPLEDGEYEFELYYNMNKIASASVEVGGREQKKPTFRNIAFSGDGTEGYLLPAGVDRVDAAFEYANMTSSTKWSYVWYYEGEDIYTGSGTAISRSTGEASVYLSKRGGLDAGDYRLELYIGSSLAATSDFLVGGGGGDGPGDGGGFFGPITFAEDERNDKPVRPGTSFESGITALHAFFDYEGMQDGWQWTRRWYIDGEVVLETPAAWEGGDSGNWWVGVNNGDDPLPDGEYELELSVQGQVVQTGDCTIGTGGTRPTPTPTPQDGVDIYGWVTDADTGRGIPGALFIVLMPGISVAEFAWTDDEVYALGEADRDGYYELSQPLERGQYYSMIIGAKSYDAIAEDDVYVDDDIESPFELNVTLQK